LYSGAALQSYIVRCPDVPRCYSPEIRFRPAARVIFICLQNCIVHQRDGPTAGPTWRLVLFLYQYRLSSKLQTLVPKLFHTTYYTKCVCTGQYEFLNKKSYCIYISDTENSYLFSRYSVMIQLFHGIIRRAILHMTYDQRSTDS
jgi:hypothetical protein